MFWKPQLREVYPRVGGGTGQGGPSGVRARGLSPRGRGNLADEGVINLGKRSIPAWAGEPQPRRPGTPSLRVYPRVGGGTGRWGRGGSPNAGLSPRGRGNRRGQAGGLSPFRSIPAWAGEPGILPLKHCLTWVYPRVGGGTLFPNPGEARCRGLSPRGRGNRGMFVDIVLVCGSIPAWAGEPVIH